MEIKTFEAFSMKEAIKTVKSELGSNAVILSTKEKREGDGNTLYEITAGIAGSKSIMQRSAPASFSALDESKIGDLGLKLAAISEKGATARQVQGVQTTLSELRELLIESLRGKDGSTISGLSPELIALDRKLRSMHVDPEIISKMMKHLRNGPVPEGKSWEEREHAYRNLAIRWLMKRIRIAPQWTPMTGSTQYHVFVGATGAGKTSLVAKLAAHCRLRKKAKVVVTSLDPRRLAAADQMRVFCKIVGVPFEPLSTPDDLAGIAQRHAGAEFVLVDTSGQSPRCDATLGELDSLKSLKIPLEFHLCVSATEKYEQAERAVQHFSNLGLQSLAFTKVDESWSYGEIVNLGERWSLPLSFFSIGPNIPDDFEIASRERVIGRIFSL